MAVARLDAAASSTSESFSYAVSAGSNRGLIVSSHTRVQSGSEDTTTATYGGQAMTRIASKLVGSSVQTLIDLFFLGETGIAVASGATVSISTTSTTNAYVVVAASYSNIDQDTPYSNVTEEGTAGSTPNPLSITNGVSEDGLVLASGATSGSNASCTWGSDLTEQIDQEASPYITGSYADEPTPSGKPAVTASSTWTNQFGAVLVFVELHPSDLAQTVSLNVTAETDAALSITAAPGSATQAVGLASETDAALAINAQIGGVTIEVGLAPETDAALAIQALRAPIFQAVGIAVETGAALTITILAVDTTSLKEDAWSACGDNPLVLLTIDHDDLAEPIRVVNNNEEVTSRGNIFTAYPFEIYLPDSLEDAPPTARVRIDNVAREIGQTIRALSDPPTVDIEVVRMVDPDVVEAAFPAMVLRNVRYDSLIVSGDLAFENLVREPYPAHTFSPGNFPGLVQ